MLMYQEVLSIRHLQTNHSKSRAWHSMQRGGSEADGGRILPNRKVRRAIQRNAGL